MPIYQFRGRHFDTAQVITGEKSAPSRHALAEDLRNHEILPIKISERPVPFHLPWNSRVSAKDLALFTRQFSVMLDSGLPLLECLELQEDHQKNDALRSTLGQVRLEVESGSTLHEAMAKHPKIFDSLFVNMIAAGETGGMLDGVLKRLSLFSEKRLKLKRAVISASVYPAVVVAVAAFIVFIIMIWVVPVFSTLFESLNAPLPLPTRVVMNLSSFMAELSIPIVVAVTLCAGVLARFYKSRSGRLVVDRILLRAPVVGGAIKKIAISRFARTLSTLMVSGVPILESLEITAGTAGNAIIDQEILEARKAVEEGKKLVDPMQESRIFPPMVTQIIGVGEQTGRLDLMLEKLAEYYEEESDAAIKNMLTLLEPIMIVFLGVVIGGIVISMYLPIFTLIGRLARGV